MTDKMPSAEEAVREYLDHYFKGRHPDFNEERTVALTALILAREKAVREDERRECAELAGFTSIPGQPMEQQDALRVAICDRIRARSGEGRKT